ncbi:G1/S-specific cyclin-E2 [Irineochytrium annulatum]|nr:G1/S-specific cyclin-E2 [Irineochytrium annulatum]
MTECEMMTDLVTWRYLVDREPHTRPETNYLNEHPCLSKEMRMILVQWMNEVCHLHTYSRQTWHRSVALLDFYLSKLGEVSGDVLQFIGATMLFAAAKIEELDNPYSGDFISFAVADEDETDRQHAVAKLLKFEHKLNECIKGQLDLPTAFDFFSIFCRNHSFIVWEKDKRTSVLDFHATASYKKGVMILDSVLLDDQSLLFSSSGLAAAVFASVYRNYRDDLQVITGFTSDQVAPATTFIKAFDNYWKLSGSFQVDDTPTSHYVQSRTAEQFDSSRMVHTGNNSMWAYVATIKFARRHTSLNE